MAESVASADKLCFCMHLTTTEVAQCLTSLFKPLQGMVYPPESGMTTEEKTTVFACSWMYTADQEEEVPSVTEVSITSG